MRDRRSALLILSVFLILRDFTVCADILCYACSSYMRQCQPELLASGVRNIFKSRCGGKCFIRQGEDNATYRGCFDGFASVVDLTDNYIGCRKQSWNNRDLLWCLCDTDLCNVQLDNAAGGSGSSQPELRPRPPPPPPSQHPLRRLPSAATGNLRRQDGSLPVLRAIDRKHETTKKEFFESFADKTKSGRRPLTSPPEEGQDSKVGRSAEGRPAVDEAKGQRSATDDEPPEDDSDARVTSADRFGKQSSRDVSEEPIGLIDFRVKGEKEEEEAAEEAGGKGPSTGVKLGAAVFQSLDYPFNQEIRPQMAPVPKRVAVETVLDMRELGTRSSSAASDVIEKIGGRTNRPEMINGRGEDSDDFGQEETTDAVAMESEDYPYNQILNQGVSKEEIERMTNPRSIELRFRPHWSQVAPPAERGDDSSRRLAPPGESPGATEVNEIGNQLHSTSSRSKTPSRSSMDEENPSPHQGQGQRQRQGLGQGQGQGQGQGPGQDILWVERLRESPEDEDGNLKNTPSVADSVQIDPPADTKTEESRTGTGKKEPTEEGKNGNSIPSKKSAEVATAIRCSRTGYDANPTDCSQFIACLLDPRSRDYILHFMRCPDGLLWDNDRKLCMDASTTCLHDNGSYGNAAV